MFSYNTLNRIYYVVGCLFIGICVYLLLVDAVPFLACLLMLDLSLWCVGSVCRTAMQNRENAQEYLKQLQEIEDKKGKNKAAIEILTRSLANRELELALELGSELDYTEKIEQLKHYLDGADNVLNRVYYHYLLYVLYGKTGNADEAQKCREYIRENGGDTCYVQWVM